jgi:tellurium resistance protein TerD
MTVPQLNNIVRKGQKVPLENTGNLSRINACLGWNIKNPACDVDVSAFLLSANKVISDDWFVFYGHPNSPDSSTAISSDNGTDRQIVSIDFTKLDERVEKIVFVLTINEALEKRLNFSMIQDAYVRILDADTRSELVSFMMDEYYDNVTSMMIGEVYKYNGAWKFNAIGNGVARDLAGLCELYGVQVD